jgi:hypothetical protein
MFSADLPVAMGGHSREASAHQTSDWLLPYLGPMGLQDRGTGWPHRCCMLADEASQRAHRVAWGHVACILEFSFKRGKPKAEVTTMGFPIRPRDNQPDYSQLTALPNLYKVIQYITP